MNPKIIDSCTRNLAILYARSYKTVNNITSILVLSETRFITLSNAVKWRKNKKFFVLNTDQSLYFVAENFTKEISTLSPNPYLAIRSRSWRAIFEF